VNATPSPLEETLRPRAEDQPSEVLGVARAISEMRSLAGL